MKIHDYALQLNRSINLLHFSDMLQTALVSIDLSIILQMMHLGNLTMMI